MDMENVKQRMKERGVTQEDLAKALRIHPTAVSKMLAGKRGVKAKEAALISELLEIKNVGYSPMRELPVIERTAAANWSDAVGDSEETMACPDESIAQNAFIIEVDGDSMAKIAPEGSRVVVDPTDRDLVEGKSYVIVNGDSEPTFATYMSNPARLEPCSTDPDQKAVLPGQDQFVIVGRVAWAMQRL
jgi:repressor LexA